MDDIRSCMQCAEDRVKEAEAKRNKALKMVEAARCRVKIINAVSFGLINEQIAKIQTEIEGELRAKEKSPQAAPRGKVEGINGPALGLRPLPGIANNL